MSTILKLAAAVFVAWRLYKLLPQKKWLRTAVMSVYCAGAVAFILAMFSLIDYLPMGLASVLYAFGNGWFVFLMYATIFIGVLELLRLMKILPDRLLERNAVITIALFAIVAGLMTYGTIHNRQKYRVEMQIASPKIDKPVKVVLLSDVHSGYVTRYKQLSSIVNMVNREQPDLVLLGGDLVDRSLVAAQKDHDANCLRRLNAPVYACLGNHEYYADEEESAKFYEQCGITLLKDSVATVCGLTLVGRSVEMKPDEEERTPLYKILRKADRSKFIILLDHIPGDFVEAQLEKVDFQFSGHTHGGQFWPVTWLSHLGCEDPYGAMTKGGTHYYVTSGIGVWGVPMRIGTRSEYLVLTLVPQTQP